MTIGATALALGGLRADDPWVTTPMLVISWAAFIYLCVAHTGKWYSRGGVGLSITITLALIGLRIYRPVNLSGDGAKIEVTSVTGVNLRSELGRGFGLNITFTNKGNRAAQNVLHKCELVAMNGPMSADEEMKYMDAVGSDPFVPTAQWMANEMQPGDQSFFSCPEEDKPLLEMEPLSQLVLQGHGERLYAFVTYKYTDALVPANKVRVSEFCGFFRGTFDVWHNCGRNRIFLATAAPTSVTPATQPHPTHDR